MQGSEPPLRSDATTPNTTVKPWSMTWGWACRCGLLWPSSVTLWWVSSYSSYSASSTKPAKCLRSRRRRQCLQSRSRRRLSRSTCWPQPDDLSYRMWFFRHMPPSLYLFSSQQLLLFLFCFICVICGADWAKSCGKTNNNKPAQSSYLCCALQHCPSVWLFALLYTGRPQFPLLLTSTLSQPSIWDKRNCGGKTANSQWIRTGSLGIMGFV